MKAEYLEVEVDGRRCFVNVDDFRLFSGLASHRTAADAKPWSEIEEDSFILQITVMRKWNRRRVVPPEQRQLGR